MKSRGAFEKMGMLVYALKGSRHKSHCYWWNHEQIPYDHTSGDAFSAAGFRCCGELIIQRALKAVVQ